MIKFCVPRPFTQLVPSLEMFRSLGMWLMVMQLGFGRGTTTSEKRAIKILNSDEGCQTF